MNRPVVRCVPAAPGDLAPLLTLMKEYYTYDGLDFAKRRATSAVNEMLGDESLGRIWMISVDGELAGYAVLVFTACLEFGGRVGYLDELYLRKDHRGKGIGSEVIAFLKQLCIDQGLAALRLEVERHNTAAREFYLKAGFRKHERDLLTLEIW